MHIERFDCVLCGDRSVGVERWRRGDWRVVRCLECGLLRTWPIPDLEDLRLRYEQPDYHHSRAAGREQGGAWRLRAESVIANLPNTTSSVLDFGAGRGQLVRALREMHIDAEGFEPSRVSRAEALESHGVELFAALVPQWVCRFDAIVMLHSLEHVVDPVETLVGLREMLSGDGRVFVEVPHAGAGGMRNAKRRAAILDLPLHLHHFTPRTLSLVVAGAGYEVETLQRINTRSVERLLSWRASTQTALGQRADTGRSGGSGPIPALNAVAATGASAARIWANAVLAGSRRAFPGDTFQIVARTG